MSFRSIFLLRASNVVVSVSPTIQALFPSQLISDNLSEILSSSYHHHLENHNFQQHRHGFPANKLFGLINFTLAWHHFFSKNTSAEDKESCSAFKCQWIQHTLLFGFLLLSVNRRKKEWFVNVTRDASANCCFFLITTPLGITASLLKFCFSAEYYKGFPSLKIFVSFHWL